MCRDLYTVKVCAASQSAAEAYLQETHGVIVKANCKKALNVLCSSVGGGSPTDQYEEICCKVANQCESDEDCGAHEDPYTVGMCCSHCMGMYGEACETAQPVHAGFITVGSLYNSFYGTDVWERCREHCVETRNASAPAPAPAPPLSRYPGRPCLREPDPAPANAPPAPASPAPPRPRPAPPALTLLAPAAALLALLSFSP